MVVQADKPIAIWGKADAQEHVEVQLGDLRTDTGADANGQWSVQLPARKAGN